MANIVSNSHEGASLLQEKHLIFAEEGYESPLCFVCNVEDICRDFFTLLVDVKVLQIVYFHH